ESEEEPEEAPATEVKKLGIKPVFTDESPEPEAVEISEEEDKEKWFEPEGQLAIDIYQTETDLVIQSAIAGVKPGSLDITMEKDVITIRGSREKPFEESGDFFTQECFWGPFSREIILPAEIDPNRARAEMKEGILTIRIPKMLRERKRKISIS
ncbi:MAG: Hsp20/alpha crystallin family protein, partial [bacterium]|nr:Hsp20/alpha crystallin family protein [bacterium]